MFVHYSFKEPSTPKDRLAPPSRMAELRCCEVSILIGHLLALLELVFLLTGVISKCKSGLVVKYTRVGRDMFKVFY